MVIEPLGRRLDTYTIFNLGTILRSTNYGWLLTSNPRAFPLEILTFHYDPHKHGSYCAPFYGSYVLHRNILPEFWPRSTCMTPLPRNHTLAREKV